MSIGMQAVNQPLAVPRNKLIRLWNTLTEPSHNLMQPEQRSQARLLAAVSLILALIVTTTLIALQLLSINFFFTLGVVTLLGLLAAYALSRSIYVNVGAIIILLISILVPIAAFLINPSQDYILAILINSIAFSSVYFSARVTRAIVAGDITVLIALAWLRPAFTPLHLILLIFFLLTESLLIVLVAHFRQQYGTQQQAQARAIAESELRYRRLAENATDFICRHRLDGVFLFTSPAGHTLLGYEPDELLGQSPYDYIHPDDIAIVRASHENVLATTQTNLVVYRFRRKDGSYIWFESTSKTIRDPQTGEPWEIVTVSRDISRRKQVEAGLKESEERFRAAAEASMDAFYLFQSDRDETGTITDFIFVSANARGLQLINKTHDAVIGQRLCELMPFNRTDGFFDKYVKVVETGIALEEEFSIRVGNDNRVIWLQHQVVPVLDGVAITTRNINERKRDEGNLHQTNLRLEASRDTLQRLIQQMPIGIQMFDTKGLCTNINEAHQSIFGLNNREQVVGKFNILTDRFAEKVGTQDGYKRALAGEIAYVGEVEFDFKQADPRFTALTGEHFLSVSFFPVYDENHIIVGVVALNQDITERKLAEKSLKHLAAELLQQKNTLNAIVSATPDQLAIFDPEGRYLYINPPGLATLGASMADVQDRTWRELGGPTDIGEKFDRELAQVFASGQPLTSSNKFPSLVGTRDYEYALSPVLDSEGQVVLAVLTNRDVTEQRQAEQERFELALERERVKMLQHLISDTSHDLKTPLATLNTSLYLLKKTISDPERREHYAEVLQAQVVNLTKILEDMDSIARLDGASDEFEFQSIDLNELLRQIVNEHETLASKKNQRLAFNAGAAIPIMPIDPTKLRRAITNLVTNALNYTPDGGEISAHMVHEDGNVIIEICDNGMGIAPNELALIFDRFYRSEESRKNYSNGSGLGLAITKKIVEGHGGTIQVESEIGRGSIFRIVLPLTTA